ncbi:sucrose phosphorylase [Shewanella baltica]|uniref:sucrose phosphorylase n=1 Tax=Shewanella baltica TaxID=62322 RepID=UPI00217DA1CF|nr:sucrose phosphorylase [Shewanella baltica]MCS6210273.1 sucrose phosphorylase [Shewanella baltica]
MKNQVQLITYVDRITNAGLKELKALLDDELQGLFGGVHLLPFYFPIDGSDAGFDPIDHVQVDSRLGNWDDVKRIGDDYDIMADLIVNHMSAESPEFKDVLKHGKQSAYWDLFLTKDKVFPEGLSEQDQATIYRPRPGSCFSTYTLADGSTEEFWTTFTRNQIDIDVHSAAGKDYLNRVLARFDHSKVNLIRLDAAGYAIKKPGTSCFMIEESFEFVDKLAKQANELGMTTLAEIHSHHMTQVEIAKRVDMVYDFALPPLILHTLFSQDCKALTHWLEMAPRNCITVLDTHDGIGIIDVGPMDGLRGLLTEDQIDNLVETIHGNSKGESLQATGAAASNVDLYQINCTYYDALGQNDLDYLMARAIQFFAPGIPQVYYAGLLAIPNDMDLLNNTHVGRDINRPYLNREKVQQAMQKPVVKALTQLIKLRNSSPAFDGRFTMASAERTLTLSWTAAEAQASLTLDFANKDGQIILLDKQGKETQVSLSRLLAQA